ncbi:MAG: molybdenum ABC transporter ATP-binding protein [Pseudomonadales bacterium]
MSADRLSVAVRIERAGFDLDLSEDIVLDGVTAVFGPSGSGKSTLLRALAGFEAPLAGRVALGDSVWFDAAVGIDVPPHRRPVGFMFQDARLFAHLDVAGNLAYARKRRREHPGIAREAVVAALDLEPLLARAVATLSGGERQRVALGRTLLSAPRLLLLDEPLAALDRQRKIDILPYLEDLPRQFGIPTLYVSHDIDEVATLADRFLVLAQGRVQMHDRAAAVLERLDLQPLTGRFEAGVLVEATVVDHDPRLHVTHVDVAGDRLTMPLLVRAAVGDAVRLRIRARDVSLALTRPEGLSIRNILPGRLVDLTTDIASGFVEALVELRGARVRARLTLAALEDLRLRRGLDVFVLIKSVSFERLE